MTVQLVVLCPPGPATEPGPDDVRGCGRTFAQNLASIVEDPDHWVDCPHCGMFFDPTTPDTDPIQALGGHL